MNENVSINGLSSARATSAKKKWLWGCGIGCLTIMIILAAVGWLGYSFIKGKYSEITAELEELGFHNIVKGQIIEVSEEITEPTLYLGQMVKILSDVDMDIAILSQTAEIHGIVNGTVYFRGQVLIIHPTAEIKKDVDVIAQVINNYGKVAGRITGVYQSLNDKR